MSSEKENPRKELSLDEFLSTRKGMSLDEFFAAGHVFAGGEEAAGEFSHPEAFKDKPYLQDVKDIDSLYTKLDGFANNQVGEFSHPDEYKDKPYLQDVKDIKALYAKFDGAEALLGKNRTVIPDDKSTDEEVAAFHEARGVPKEDSAYEPINKTDGVDNTFFDAMRPVFKGANLTQAQVRKVEEGLGPVLEKITGKKTSDDNITDAEFTKLAEGVFGATKDTDLANAKVLITTFTPDSMKQQVDKLSNENLIVLASVLKGVRSKFINEDASDALLKGKTNVTTGADLRKAGQEQIVIANDPEKTPAEREEATNKANELYDEYEKTLKKT